MTAQRFYNTANKNGMYLECTCVGISQHKWDRLMSGAVRADKKIVNSLLKKHEVVEPDLLLGYNPYNFFRTKTHIIFVHSAIEYFIKVG